MTLQTSVPLVLEVHGLRPPPEERWRAMGAFAGPLPAELDAMRATVEILFRHGPDLVADTYDYLLHTRETAAVLGWEDGADPEHLAERRRFFTIWLARVLGLDFGDGFAGYLFRAGQMHAGHGPRRITVPDQYVIGSIGLVVAAFAGYIEGEVTDTAVAARAVAGWNKYLLMQLDLMLTGATVARDLDSGDVAVPVNFFGRLRNLTDRAGMAVHVPPGAAVESLLRKVFDYLPQLRVEALDVRWQDATPSGARWMEVAPVYVARRGWRVLLNGRDIAFERGLATTLAPGDTLDIFPPGR